jgi:hypothetical protein
MIAGHSKSVSWHVTSDSRTVTPKTTLLPAQPEDIEAGSISYDSYFRHPPSPQRRRARMVQPGSISTNSDSDFIFPYARHSPALSEPQISFFSDEEGLISSITSPPSSADTSSGSPYILNSQPSLQEIFILLAHKERRVLEAKEQLSNAEKELTQFKKQWNSILNIPPPKLVVPSEPASPLALATTSPRIPKTAQPYGLGINALSYCEESEEDDDKLEWESVGSDISQPVRIVDPKLNFPLSPVYLLRELIRGALTLVFELSSTALGGITCAFKTRNKQPNSPIPLMSTRVRPRYPSITETYYGAYSTGVAVGNSTPRKANG